VYSLKRPFQQSTIAPDERVCGLLSGFDRTPGRERPWTRSPTRRRRQVHARRLPGTVPRVIAALCDERVFCTPTRAPPQTACQAAIFRRVTYPLYHQCLPLTARLQIVCLKTLFCIWEFSTVRTPASSHRFRCRRTKARKFSVFRELASMFLKTMYFTRVPSLQPVENRRVAQNTPVGRGQRYGV
jgi:hypothetical protein